VIWAILFDMTCYQEITCPHCGSNQIMKVDRSAEGTQRYCCQKPDCDTNLPVELPL